jgi:hypothetical protein
MYDNSKNKIKINFFNKKGQTKMRCDEGPGVGRTEMLGHSGTE